MKSIKLTLALLVLTLMSCSTEDTTQDIPTNPEITQDLIIGTWNPVRYEIYPVGATEPSEVVDISCGIVFTIEAKEEPDTFRVLRTDCSGNTAINYQYQWIKTGNNTYTYETSTERVIEVNGDVMTDRSGGWEVGVSDLVMFYDRSAPINTDN